MKILNANGREFEAENIIKTGDDIIGYDAYNNVYFALKGISDFTGFSITNEDGTTTDLINLDTIKQDKIDELNKLCEFKIINEFYSDCLGNKDSEGNLIKDHFECRDRDQIYIQGLANKATLMMNGILTDGILDWKRAGEPVCYPFPQQSCTKLGLDMFSHISENRKRYEQLSDYIRTKLDTAEEVNIITWDSDINATA